MSTLIEVSDKAITAITALAPWLKNVTVDSSVTPCKGYSKVQVKIVSPAVESFGDNGYWSNSSSLGYVDISLSNRKVCTLAIDDKDYAEDELDAAIEAWAPAGGREIARELEKTYVSTLNGLTPLTTLSYGSAGASVADLTLLDIATMAQDVKSFTVSTASYSYDPSQCAFVCPAGVYAKILSLLPSSTLGQGRAVVDGTIGSLLGFGAVYPLPVVNETASTQFLGLIVPKGAVCAAARVYAPQNSSNLVEYHADSSEAGWPVSLRVSRDEKLGKQHYALESVFGFAGAYDGTTAPKGPQVVAVRLTASAL